jgi:hypothetical protein
VLAAAFVVAALAVVLAARDGRRAPRPVVVSTPIPAMPADPPPTVPDVSVEVSPPPPAPPDTATPSAPPAPPAQRRARSRHAAPSAYHLPPLGL